MNQTNDAFRPRTWDEYKGQVKLKERLHIHIESAKMRDETLPHILLVAPAGYGKTSIASIIAGQMEVRFRSFAERLAPAVFDAMIRTAEGVVLFDEIHNWSDAEQGRLLTLIEDGYVQSWTGERLYHKALTVIAATTQGDQILPPLYQRFPIIPTFEEYSTADMISIIEGMAKRMDEVPLMPGMARALAVASCGTPRVAKQLLIMLRDITLATGQCPSSAQEVLDRVRMTPTGLNPDHVRYLRALTSMGGQAGLETIRHHVRLPKDVLLDLERLLVHQRLITYTTRGRVITLQGTQTLGGIRG